MWLPVSILAGLAVVLGFLNYPESLHRILPIVPAEVFSKWIEPLLLPVAPAHHGEHVPPSSSTVSWPGPPGVGPGAMLLAWWIYKVDPSWSRAKAFVARFPNLFRWVNAKYYVTSSTDAASSSPSSASPPSSGASTLGGGRRGEWRAAPPSSGPSS